MGTGKKLELLQARITCSTFVVIGNDGTLNVSRISKSIWIIDAQIIAFSLYYKSTATSVSSM